MRLEARKHIYEIHRAAMLLSAFTVEKTLSDYERDVLLRAAVEREFIVIGESLQQLSKIDETIAARITDYRRIVGFRNLLIHTYANIDDSTVWELIEKKLPVLRAEVDALLVEMEPRA